MRNRYNEDAYDEVVRDGQAVRVPLALMDAQQRSIAFDAAGYPARFATPLNDAAQHDRAAARLRYIEDLTSAWMTPARRAMADRTLPITGNVDPQRARSMAYDAMVSRLGSAWKTTPLRDQEEPDDDPDNDPNAANIVEQQRREITAEDLERRRQKIHADYSARLSSAWRGGK